MQTYPWHSFTKPCVKDLAFALACPSALSHFPNALQDIADAKTVTLPSDDFWAAQFSHYLPRLKALEQDPKPLNLFLAKQLTSLRLGFRFEALMLFWLQDSAYHDFELIGHNIQLIHNAQTLGELDFVVFNKKTQRIEHWELAVKFYLGCAPYAPENWVGLNEKDTLAKKLTHTLSKPFRFEVVNIDGFDYRIDVRRAIIKGRFFVPKNDVLVHHALPTWLNSNLPMGLWQSGFDDLQNTPNWRRAHRAEWLTKRDFLDRFELGTHPKQLANEVARFYGRRVPLTLGKGLYFQLNSSLGEGYQTIKNQPRVDRSWLVIKK